MVWSVVLKSRQLVALALVGAVALTACTSSKSVPSGTRSGTNSGQFGNLPSATGTPVEGGTVSIAESPGAGPTYIFPITPAADFSFGSITQFQYYMWRPLWWQANGDVPAIDYSASIASGPPVFTDDNKTATITLKSGWRWSDGVPVTSTDVAFFIDILKAAVRLSPANYGPYTPGQFPDNVTSISTPNPTTVVLTFSKTYNQNFLFLDQLAVMVPLPAHAWARASATGPLLNFTNPRNATAIYNYLNAQSSKLSTYATNPLWQTVDGPFKLTSFDPATGANTLVANKAYTGPVKPHIAQIDDVAFTSTTAEFNQLLTGSLTVGFVDLSDLPQIPQLKAEGYNIWGYPDFGFSSIVYDFQDKTGDFDNIIRQLYIRQALAHLQDEQAIIQSKGVFDGAAGQAYGPVPAVPKSPFAPPNALSNPYPFSISTASRLLSSHGWKVVPNGTTTCVRTGTGPSDCGAGIPAGTPLTWNLVYANQPVVIGVEDEVFASTAKQVGITINLSAKTYNYIAGNLSAVANPTNDNLWAMQDYGSYPDSLYPTTDNLFNSTGSFNEGLYSDKTADRYIRDSISSLNNNAVQAELAYITAQQPSLFQPNADLVFAFKKTLAGPPASFEDASQNYYSPEYWYFVKE